MSKLTKGHVREALVYEFMVSPVVRQGKGPSQYMLKFFHQVLFIIPLQWLQLSLCESKWIKTNAAALMHDMTHLGRIHATTAVMLATTLNYLHFTALLHKHRLHI